MPKNYAAGSVAEIGARPTFPTGIALPRPVAQQTSKKRCFLGLPRFCYPNFRGKSKLSRQKAQPPFHSLTVEPLQPLRKLQNDTSVVIRKRCLRQNSPHPGRDGMREPESLAKDEGTLTFLPGHEFGKLGKEFARKLALVPMEETERKKGAPRMIDADKRGLRNKGRTLLAPIIGMCAPRNIRKKACGLPEPLLFGGFAQTGALKQGIGPSDQLFGMPVRS